MAVSSCGIEESRVLAGVPKLSSLLLGQKNINLADEPLELDIGQPVSQPLSDDGSNQTGPLLLVEVYPSSPAPSAQPNAYILEKCDACIIIS